MCSESNAHKILHINASIPFFDLKSISNHQPHTKMLPYYLSHFPSLLSHVAERLPWEITASLKATLEQLIPELGEAYRVQDGIAVHHTALIEPGVTLKAPVVIGPDCFVGAHAYFREGVLLDESVKIGPGCEIKTSVICSVTAIAHFNYVGNSIIGQQVNLEAGAIVANHYNERTQKEIRVLHQERIIETGVKKFGAIVGDHSKIGANAVLSPGTLLEKHSIVERLQLIEQIQ